jgi:hypothetical protein
MTMERKSNVLPLVTTSMNLFFRTGINLFSCWVGNFVGDVSNGNFVGDVNNGNFVADVVTVEGAECDVCIRGDDGALCWGIGGAVICGGAVCTS